MQTPGDATARGWLATNMAVAHAFFWLGSGGLLIGLVLSVIVRMELQAPGLQFFTSPSLYQWVVTSHGKLAMLFGVVPMVFGGLGQLGTLRWQESAPTLSLTALRLAFWTQVTATILMIVVLGIGLWDVSAADARTEGWTHYPPLPPMLPGIEASFAVNLVMGATSAAMALVFVSVGLVAITAVTRVIHDRRQARSISPGAATWTIAALVILLTIPIAAFPSAMDLWMFCSGRFISTFFQPVAEPQWLVMLRGLDVTALVVLTSIFPIASHAIHVASGQVSVAETLERWVLITVTLAMCVASIVMPLVVAWHPLQALESTLRLDTFVAVAGLVLLVLWAEKLRRGSTRQWMPALCVLCALIIWVGGVVFANLKSGASLDMALHDTYYDVAMRHWLLFSSTALLLLAGFYANVEVLTGRSYDGRLAFLQIMMMTVGLVRTVVPQAILGLQGMPRRYVDYPSAFSYWNYQSSLGSYQVMASVVLLMIIVLFGRKVSKPTAVNMAA